MTIIVDKLVAIPAENLDEADTWIGTHSGQDKVVLPIPICAWARIVFGTKGDAFIWRCASDNAWFRDGSRAVMVQSVDLNRVQLLVDEARTVLAAHDIGARVNHWLLLKCEFVGDPSADAFAESIGGAVLGARQEQATCATAAAT